MKLKLEPEPIIENLLGKVSDKVASSANLLTILTVRRIITGQELYNLMGTTAMKIQQKVIY